MENKKTIILGATTDSSKYAYRAAERLAVSGHDIINIGRSTGSVAGVPIELPGQIYTGIDTITIYMAPHNQAPLLDYVISTNPRRIIFNPGTENSELEDRAVAKGIAVENACTLVLLATGQY